jgi:hypothetical protein
MNRLALLAIAIAVAFTAACDPVWTVRVKVRTPENQALEGAAVGVVCSGSARGASGATHSGPDGVARIGNIGYFASGCDVSIAAPGYKTVVIRHDELCRDRDCSHGTDIEATLLRRPAKDI